MRTRKVTRFYCDHCPKAGLQASAMRRHERRCFYNPARVCELCKDDQIEQQPIETLRAALVGGGVAALKLLANGCPACVCSAVIQEGKAEVSPEDRVWYDYDYKAGLKEWYQNERGKYADRYVGAGAFA